MGQLLAARRDNPRILDLHFSNPQTILRKFHNRSMDPNGRSEFEQVLLSPLATIDRQGPV
jgi:hypothetical protein